MGRGSGRGRGRGRGEGRGRGGGEGGVSHTFVWTFLPAWRKSWDIFVHVKRIVLPNFSGFWATSNITTESTLMPLLLGPLELHSNCDFTCTYLFLVSSLLLHHWTCTHIQVRFWKSDMTKHHSLHFTWESEQWITVTWWVLNGQSGH